MSIYDPFPIPLPVPPRAEKRGLVKFGENEMIEEFEISQLLARRDFSRRPSNDWRRWPSGHRKAAEAAVKAKLAELPKGSRILRRYSSVDKRADLSGLPWQLFLSIEVKIPK